MFQFATMFQKSPKKEIIKASIGNVLGQKKTDILFWAHSLKEFR